MEEKTTDFGAKQMACSCLLILLPVLPPAPLPVVWKVHGILMSTVSLILLWCCFSVGLPLDLPKGPLLLLAEPPTGVPCGWAANTPNNASPHTP